ncbi:organic solute transporter ostalpha protein [Cystoisospora suis]|uniref:Organic solute transporter ostalpha protein n=1 Tax=Cystoisospora suis TaxID=483139 RepID=A0A2C6LCR3_9APIC|nr:organic solute transporter ostalpha protein [Cystoisospora suis]
MFLEDLIYQQSAFFCVICSVIVSLFLIASHLAYAFHTDIKTVPLLLLPRIRQIFFPLSSSSSALSRWLSYPQYHPHISAPPLQPPLHVCRIVMLVPVYAITSYLAFTYAEPSSSSFLRFSSLSSVEPTHPFISPPSSVPAGSPSRRLYGNADESGLSQKSGGDHSPPRLSWMTTRTEVGGTGPLQQRKWHLSWGVPAPRGVDTPQSPVGRRTADGGQEGTKSSSSSMGGVIEEKLGVDFENLAKGTGGCLGFTLHAIRDMYEVYVLYSFIALLVAVLGGEEEAVEQLHLKGSLQHPWPFNLVFSPLDCNRRFLQSIKLCAAQFVFVKPLVTLCSLLIPQGRHGGDSPGGGRGFMYFAAVSHISAGVAMYALVLFYLAIRHKLRRSFRLLSKFLCIKAVVFFCFWQSFAVRWLVSLVFAGLSDGVGGKTGGDDQHSSSSSSSIEGLVVAAVTLRITDWMICIEMLPYSIAQALAFPVRDLQALTPSSRQGHPYSSSSYSSRGLSCYSEGRGKGKGSYLRDHSRGGSCYDDDFFNPRSVSPSSSSSASSPLHTKISRSPSSSVNGSSSSFVASSSSPCPSSHSTSPSKKKKSSRETTKKKTATPGCESSLVCGMSAKTRESLGILVHGQSEREDEEEEDEEEDSCEKKLLPVSTSLITPNESLSDADEGDRRHGSDDSEPGEEDHEEHMLIRTYNREGDGRRTSGEGKERTKEKKPKRPNGQDRPLGEYGEDPDHEDEEVKKNGHDAEDEEDEESEGFSFLKGPGGHLDLTRGGLHLKKPLKTIVNGVTNFLKCDEVLWDATDAVLGGITAGNGMRKEYHLEERVISSSSPLPHTFDDPPPSSLSPSALASLSVDTKISTGFCS